MFSHFLARARLVALGLVLGLAPGVQAQSFIPESDSESAQTPQPLPPQPRVVKLTLHPAAAPVPAMKYMLLPEVRDLKPGNAALLYQRSHSPEWWNNFARSKAYETNADYLDMPIKKMPRDKVVIMENAIREIDLAARREYCDWELTPRLRQDGLFLLIPDVQSFRVSAVQLALRARLEMLDGKFDKAVYSLETGVAMGRHINGGIL